MPAGMQTFPTAFDARLRPKGVGMIMVFMKYMSIPLCSFLRCYIGPGKDFDVASLLQIQHFFTETPLFSECLSFSPAIFHPNPSATHLAAASLPARPSKTRYIPASLPLRSAFAGRRASLSIPFLEVCVALQDAFLCFKLL